MDGFRDADVEQAHRQGGRVPLPGGRCLVLPRAFGFCGGVTHALALLSKCLERRGGRAVRLLGPVIHNETVNDWFRAQGVDILPEDRIEDILRVGGPDDIVVIPAFGVPLELAEALERRYPLEQILDTTCRNVRAVWRFLEDLEGRRWTVLIHGKPGHSETRATLSRALRQAGRVALVRDMEDTRLACKALQSDCWDGLPEGQLYEIPPLPPPDGPVALANQTTMLHDETVAIAGAVEAAARESGRAWRLADSVCRATQDRQDAAREVCGLHPDLVLVVGSATSSNTAQLFRLACASGSAYLVRNAAALSPERLEHWVPGDGIRQTSPWLPANWTRIGLLAGASCPARDIGDVVRWFRRLTGSPQRPVGAMDPGREITGEPEGGPAGNREGKNGGSDET